MIRRFLGTATGGARKVVLIGGNGYIGREIQNLIPASYETVVAARAKKSGVNVEADVTDRESIRRAIKDADVVVNLVGIMDEHPPKYTFDSVQHQGAKTVAEEVSQLKRECTLIHISAIGADASGPTPYARTKALGEAAIHDVIKQSNQARAVIIRPGLVLGREDQFLNRFALLARLLPVVPIFGSGESVYQPITVSDLAQVVVNAARSDISLAAGETCLIEVGGNKAHKFRDLIFRVSRKAAYAPGTWMRTILPPFYLPIPIPVALFQASLFERIFPPGSPLRVTQDQVRMLQLDNCVSGTSIGNPQTFKFVRSVAQENRLKTQLIENVKFQSVDDIYRAGHGWL